MSTLSINQLGSRDSNHNMIRILAKQHSAFKVCHINSQSLYGKIDEFRFLFENSDIDAVCVSETWFTNDYSDKLVELSGYQIFRSDRIGRAGGVAIYIKNTLSCKLLRKYNAIRDVEFIFVEINSHDEKLLLGCVYRPDKNIKFDSLLSELAILTVSYSSIIIAGDFNGNLLAQTGSDLMSTMTTFNLFSVNCNRPTHFTSNNSTLLDLFFVSDMNKVILYDQLAAPAFSKHDLIFVSYSFNVANPKSQITFRDYKNINMTLLEHDLNNAAWHEIYRMPSSSDQLNFLNSIILHIFNEHVPLKTKIVKTKVRPWFTRETEILIEQRDKMYLRWKRYKTTDLHNEFRRARRAVVQKIRNDKTLYYGNKFNTAVNTKQTWKQIKDIGILGTQTYIQNIDVNALNEAFVNIPQPPVELDFYANNLIAETTHQFSFHCFNLVDTVEGFRAIKSNAVGLDGIQPRFMKLILPFIIHHIIHLFNTIVTTSTFPKGWKYAKIIAVPKTDKEFRPIAILPYLSKVFERLLHKQISKHIYNNNLLTDRQSGFRPQHSCTTALTDVVEKIRSDLDNNRITFLVLLDHSKAFDTVEHNVLSLKLAKMFRFAPTAVRMISSYLSNRLQSVENNGILSRPLTVSRGVPQGSILGPLLYSLYANDLPLQIQYSNIQMYADDVQMYLSCSRESIRNCVDKINYDLDKIFKWASSNGLQLNPKKSKCLIISKKSVSIADEINIFLADSRIELVNTVRNLGVVFNRTLTWSDHISRACGRTYGMLRGLWASHNFTPHKIRLLLAKTYLLPTLLYSAELFTGCNSKDLKKLNTTFNNITRYIFGLSRFDHVSQFSNRILGVSLEKYLKFRNLVFLQKIIVTKEPKYLYNRLTFSTSQRNNNIKTFKYRDTASSNQFFILTIYLWNHLPHNLQFVGNTVKFKKLLMQYYS